MKIFKVMKDGGQESRVKGYWLVEIKRLLSVVLLHFSDGSREAYHSHAFNSISWVLRGRLAEYRLDEATTVQTIQVYERSFKPIITTRENMHKVMSQGDTFVLSFRGPWASTWREFLPDVNRFITLTHGRKVIG